MRNFGIVAGCVGLAMLVSGCDTTDSRYFSGGVGTNLYSADIAQTTQFQDIYLTELCRQALPVLATTEGQCLPGVSSQTGWDLIVQAGLNDVDRRCDAYLAWLDDRRRTNNAVLKELGDLTVATQAIMRVTGVGANPITLAGLAFGLASNTFTNINSRLLLEVDKTTVQTLVLRRRNDFRVDLRGKRISDRPSAIYALRSYLTICTPFAIETDINATVMVFQQVGPGGLENKPPLFNPSAVGVPLTAATVTSTAPSRPKGKPDIEEFKAIFVNYNPNRDTAELVGSLARKLCVLDADIRNVTKMGAAIQVYQLTRRLEPANVDVKVTGKLTDADIAQLNDSSRCDRTKFFNYYEASQFLPGGISNPDMIPLLNRALPAAQRIAAGSSADQVRTRLPDVRQAVTPAKLTLRGPPFANQLTPDLIGTLQTLPVPTP